MTDDVAVVGGGPAGAACAIACARRGLRVVVLERETFPRERPGETLHPGAEILLDDLGVGDHVRAAGFPRHEGHLVEWGGRAPRFQAFGSDVSGPWRGFHAWRATFDAILLEGARRAGARVVQPARAVSAIVDGERCVGLSTADGEIRARFTVDAGGGRQWLANELAVPIDLESPARLVRYGYAEGDASAELDVARLRGDETGWTWTARVRPGLYHWARLATDGPTSTDLPDAFAGLRPVGAARGADVTWRIARRVAGPGWFFAGDAAAVLDPTASQGVLRAIAGGIYAAHTIFAITSGRLPEDRAAPAYDEWVRRGFGETVRVLREHYAELARRET